MSNKKIVTTEEKKRITKLAKENVKLLENENAGIEQLEQVRSNLDELISVIDSAMNRDKK